MMEISNILKSEADRMIMSPHMPITPASTIRKLFFPVQSLFPCVCVYINILACIYMCVCVCTHTYAYIFFMCMLYGGLHFMCSNQILFKIKVKPL